MWPVCVWLFMALTVLAALVLAPASPYTMRLKLQAGQALRYRLSVERDGPKTSGKILTDVAIKEVRQGILTMEATLTGLEIDGRDRTADLRKIVTQPTVTFSWTNRAQRFGGMTPLEMSSSNSDIMPFLSEAGLYLCDFPAQAIKPGDEWDGSVTATGGCTSGRYRLVEVKKNLAYVEVTEIGMAYCDQLGPMKMTVDLTTGVPESIEYTVRGKTSGRKSHYVQTLLSIKR